LDEHTRKLRSVTGQTQSLNVVSKFLLKIKLWCSFTLNTLSSHRTQQNVLKTVHNREKSLKSINDDDDDEAK